MDDIISTKKQDDNQTDLIDKTPQAFQKGSYINHALLSVLAIHHIGFEEVLLGLLHDKPDDNPDTRKSAFQDIVGLRNGLLTLLIGFVL